MQVVTKSFHEDIPKNAILGIGNPLLDVSAHTPKEFMDKHGIKPGMAILAEPEHEPMFEEILKFDVEYVAGGATQNSIRIAQWMSRTEGATAYLGAVGKDQNGETLKKACTDAGVLPLYYESPDKPTGVCAVTILEKERSLTTKLEAANEYKHTHTLTPKVQEQIEASQIYYSAGFFLTVPDGPETVLHIAKHASEKNKIYCMNLSAEFLIDFFAEPMNKMFPYADFVFGNETEAAKLGSKKGWGEDLCEIALKLSALPKENGARPRVVVFTQGGDPTIVAYNGVVTKYAVPPVASDLIVDSNGAGDAFVGGFLSSMPGLLTGEKPAEKVIEEAVRRGHYAARVVIQRSGATVPAQPDFC